MSGFGVRTELPDEVLQGVVEVVVLLTRLRVVVGRREYVVDVAIGEIANDMFERSTVEKGLCAKP